MAKKKEKKKSSGKFSLVNELYQGLLNCAEVSRNGSVKIKKNDIRACIEGAFANGAKAAASGERIRFPIIGTLVRKDVKARKADKGVNPFTGEPMVIKARPATKKPRWSFPRHLKDTFANKRYW